MKFLLVLVVVLAGVWLWRRARVNDMASRQPPPARPQTPAQPPGPSAMVACAHCGLHLPANESLAGARGPYCSAEHRRLSEGGP
ncbi:PP0621 family protein [Hydrogenophaga sp. OTU3427]|uniref:PP0621 family protein n=1 Tax=Hydrogenophaga sp. OTU3427 TaxID=3043856 RepID=UPI00313EEACB